jgi:hypothetical protein
LSHKLAAVLALLLTAPSLLADALRFDPPVTNGHTSVEAVVSFVSACPQSAAVTVADHVLTIRLSEARHRFPCGEPAGRSQRVPLGMLTPGVYDVLVTSDDGSGAAIQRARRSLIVRDDSLTRGQVAFPPEGGRLLVRAPAGMPPLTAPPVVTLGGAAAQFFGAETDGWTFLVPSHDPGTVDLTVATPTGSVTAVAAVSYYENFAPPDAAFFEPIVFPVSSTASSAPVSWDTNNVITAAVNEPAVLRDPPPCQSLFSCRKEIYNNVQRIENGSTRSGVVLYAIRGTTGALSVGSVLRSHPAGSLVSTHTGLHVAREADFRDHRLFFHTTLPPNCRLRLRVWAIDAPQTVTLHPEATVGGLPAFALTLIPNLFGSSVSFGELDLTPYLEAFTSDRFELDVIVPQPGLTDPGLRMWGVLSVTTNDSNVPTVINAQ